MAIKKKEIHQLNCLNNISAFRHESKKGIREIFDNGFWELFIFENISVFVDFASLSLLLSQIIIRQFTRFQSDENELMKPFEKFTEMINEKIKKEEEVI